MAVLHCVMVNVPALELDVDLSDRSRSSNLTDIQKNGHVHIKEKKMLPTLLEMGRPDHEVDDMFDKSLIRIMAFMQAVYVKAFDLASV